jgi:flagella basal body P-ring formation protein FlgA
MKSFYEKLLLLILIGVALSAGANESYNLKISDFSSVAPGAVTLGSLVEQTNLDKADDIFKIEFGTAPKAGEKMVFSNRAISQAIARFLALLPSDKKSVYDSLKITIPNDTVVQGNGWESSLVLVERQIRKSFEELCGTSCSVEDLTYSSIHYDQKYGTDAWVSIDPIKALPKGSFNIQYKVTKNGASLDQGWVQGKFRIMKNAAVAKRFLNAGWHLQSEDFEMRKVDVTMETDSAADPAKLMGLKLARTLNANQVILNSAIARESDVVFGQTVKAVIKEEDWQVSIDGIARDTGSVGDHIKVFNPNSKKTLMGVLTAKGIVEIQ